MARSLLDGATAVGKLEACFDVKNNSAIKAL